MAKRAAFNVKVRVKGKVYPAKVYDSGRIVSGDVVAKVDGREMFWKIDWDRLYRAASRGTAINVDK